MGGSVNLVGNGLCIFLNDQVAKGSEFFFLVITSLGMGFVFRTNTVLLRAKSEGASLAPSPP